MRDARAKRRSKYFPLETAEGTNSPRCAANSFISPRPSARLNGVSIHALLAHDAVLLQRSQRSLPACPAVSREKQAGEVSSACHRHSQRCGPAWNRRRKIVGQTVKANSCHGSRCQSMVTRYLGKVTWISGPLSDFGLCWGLYWVCTEALVSEANEGD